MTAIGMGISILTGSKKAAAGAALIPSNVSLPEISGVARVGVQLICSQGTWNGSPSPTFAYQWKAGGVNVGINSNLYTPGIGDVSKVMTCAVTATNASGNATATSLGTLPVESSGSTLAQRLLGNEPNGVAVGFLDNSILIRDTVTPANNFEGLATTKLAFTRSTVGFYVNSAGLLVSAAINTMRLHYDPISHVALGMLAESSATNLCLQSQSLAAPWAVNGSAAVPNTTETLSPDGTNNATKLTFAPGTNNIGQTFTAPSLNPISYTAIIKAGTKSDVTLYGNTGLNQDSVIFKFSSGTFSFVGTGVISTLIVPLLNGWFIVSFTVIATTTTASASSFFYANDADGSIYVWNTQIEVANEPTSPIITTIATVARGFDSCNLATTAFNFSTTVGTLVSEPKGLFALASPLKYQASLNDGSAANLLAHNLGAAQSNLVTSVSVNQANINVGTGTVEKIASAWALNDFAASAQGLTAVVDAAGTIPAGITTFTFGGRNTGGAAALQGCLAVAMYLPRRATNIELQQLSIPVV